MSLSSLIRLAYFRGCLIRRRTTDWTRTTGSVRSLGVWWAEFHVGLGPSLLKHIRPSLPEKITDQDYFKEIPFLLPPSPNRRHCNLRPCSPSLLPSRPETALHRLHRTTKNQTKTIDASFPSPWSTPKKPYPWKTPTNCRDDQLISFVCFPSSMAAEPPLGRKWRYDLI